MGFLHQPVMTKEAMSFLVAPQGSRFIDGTIGQGGHAELLLASQDKAVLIGIDRDGEALEDARARLAPFGSRVRLFRGRFAQMAEFAAQAGWDAVDGVLLDLGMSSLQLDSPARGFSFRVDGPLDMRMDMRSQVTAASLLNHRSEDELADIFFNFGEERRARRLARALTERRRRTPWERTGELAELIEVTIGSHRRRKTPAATRCFQALRIAVNGELDELPRGLEAAVSLLRPGGRLVAISFHSLEDRIVKNFFRDQAADCVCPPDFPVCVCRKQATLRVLTRKPARPGDDEVRANRRAAPARLRAAERLPGDARTHADV